MSCYHEEHGYLQLLRDVQTLGERRKNRTGIDTLSLVGPQISFSLDAFPLLTTKRVWFKGIAVELDWMLRGESNTAYLNEHGVKIWNDNADEQGELGPVYGVQWRRWPRWKQYDPNVEDQYGFKYDAEQAHLEGHIDQIAQIVDKLRHHREDRRIILSAWNVAQIDQMRLPPCHYAAQFLVDNDNRLTCIVSVRSWDMFLGAPFNIAQYALLTSLLAHVSGLVPHKLIINAGDAHIYVNHLEQVREQCEREIRRKPSLSLDRVSKEDIDLFEWDQVSLQGYDPHPAIKGEMAV
jgi:thymidylate synthase